MATPFQKKPVERKTLLKVPHLDASLEAIRADLRQTTLDALSVATSSKNEICRALTIGVRRPHLTHAGRRFALWRPGDLKGKASRRSGRINSRFISGPLRAIQFLCPDEVDQNQG